LDGYVERKIVIKKQVIEMGSKELEELIKKTYGHPYDYTAQEGLGNDMEQTYKIEREPLNHWESEDIAVFKDKGQIEDCWTRTLLQDMVNNNVLEPGEYLIQVSW